MECGVCEVEWSGGRRVPLAAKCALREEVKGGVSSSRSALVFHRSLRARLFHP